MSVLVGIIANDSARYSLFASCVTNLELPEGAKVEWLIGGDWCGARNNLCRMALDDGYDYLWFMDDDHAFAPGLLKGLLRWNVPLVNPLCLARTAPFPLVTYAAKAGENLYLPIVLDGAPEEGLVELEAGGCAGMLIRRDVLEAIEPPWFEYTDRSEDIVFCEKAKAAGFKLYGDLAARLGHITTAVVWPAVNEGQWMTGITVGRDLNLFVSAASEWTTIEQEPAVARPEESPPAPEQPSPRVVERVEMWVEDLDGRLRWWVRAIGLDGAVLSKSSAMAQESYAIEYAEREWPGVDLYLIRGELEDSRSERRYGPPQRLWTRGAVG